MAHTLVGGTLACCDEIHRHIVNPVCDKCGADLNFVGHDRRIGQYEQYKDALHVSLYGGYGEYIDLMPSDTPPKAVLCKTCADTFLKENPWLLDVMPLTYRRWFKENPPGGNEERNG